MNQNPQTKPWLGCIADDYTGATDLASFLVKTGLRTVQINGLPTAHDMQSIPEVDAIVIALKTRSIEANEAVKMSLEALAYLQGEGCKKYYFKYCSTFDSSPQGNIGPVCDALMEALEQESTIICPALPINGRTVYQGHLFVHGELLNESPMKDHPITPMKDANIVRMIEAQGKGKAGLIAYSAVDAGEQHILNYCQSLVDQYQYIVVDALNDQHLKNLEQCVEHFTLITGGSGLATCLANEFIKQGGKIDNSLTTLPFIAGNTLVLSGSCSSMTQQQVAQYAIQFPCWQIEPNELMNNPHYLASIVDWIDKNKEQAPLVSATSTPEQVVINKESYGENSLATKIEDCLSSIAKHCVEHLGFSKVVVAGGETSGAVVNALKVKQFLIGEQIAPGVPIIQTIDKPTLNLALKSGNFGEQDFFIKAVETLSCK